MPDALNAQVLPGVPPYIVPLPEQRTLSINASGGFTLTSGNKDSSTINAGYEVIYDPKTKNIARSDGLYLRGRSEGVLTADQLALNARDEYRVFQRGFVFGQMQYVRDRFKNIHYLASGTAGLGYRFVDRPETKLSLDTGLGGVWEKDIGVDLVTTGAFTYAEKFSHQLNPMVTVTQQILALHKTDDFKDSLHVFGTGIAASITRRTQFKVELRDTYKNHLTDTTLVKNDVALILAVVYRN